MLFRIKLYFLMAFCLSITLLLCALLWLRPLYLAYAENQAQQTASYAIYEAVLDQVYQNRADYAALVTLEREDDGSVTALCTDGILSNYLRVQIEKNVFQALSVLEHEQLTIPLGSMVLPEMLGGYGPELTVGMAALGDVHSAFTSQFTDAGINQTRHQMVLTVYAEVEVLTLFGSQTTPVTVELPVTDTVLVGEVPQSYTYVDDQRQDLLGKINDYTSIDK